MYKNRVIKTEYHTRHEEISVLSAIKRLNKEGKKHWISEKTIKKCNTAKKAKIDKNLSQIGKVVAMFNK